MPSLKDSRISRLLTKKVESKRHEFIDEYKDTNFRFDFFKYTILNYEKVQRIRLAKKIKNEISEKISKVSATSKKIKKAEKQESKTK